MLGDHMFQEVGKNKAGCASAYWETTCVGRLLETEQTCSGHEGGSQDS